MVSFEFEFAPAEMLGHEIALRDRSAVMIDLIITVGWLGSMGLRIEFENAMHLGDGLRILRRTVT